MKHSKPKIAVLTGSRAEFGQLEPLFKLLIKDPEIECQLLVTGSHLSKEHGNTVDQIRKSGYVVTQAFDLEFKGDHTLNTTYSMGIGLKRFGEFFSKDPPDLLLVLGDRFEILSAVTAALIHKIPVAHIGGGDTTEGAFDESIRHSITKMSHLHFATHQKAAERILQMGENPAHVFNVGSLAVDQILSLDFISKDQLENELGCKFRSKNAIVTFHPETLYSGDPQKPFEALLSALDKLKKTLNDDLAIFFTFPNADPGHDWIVKQINEYSQLHPNVFAFQSLGSLRYLSLMKCVDLVAGNSSSGLYEAPSLKKPTVNIGERQKGRVLASSVLSCSDQESEIFKNLKLALNLDCKDAVNPYGDGKSAPRIHSLIKEALKNGLDLKKRFFDYPR